MAGGSHGGHGHAHTHAGVSFHPPKRWQVRSGQAMCAIMWFWVLYRAKEDGPVLLGWRHPWEGHGHGHGHDDGHGHDKESHSEAHH